MIIMSCYNVFKSFISDQYFRGGRLQQVLHMSKLGLHLLIHDFERGSTDYFETESVNNCSSKC